MARTEYTVRGGVVPAGYSFTRNDHFSGTNNESKRFRVPIVLFRTFAKQFQRTHPQRDVVLLSFLCLIGFALYLPGLSAERFGDDLRLIKDQPASGFFSGFWRPTPFGFYRPIEASFAAFVQVVFGTQTWPIHLVHLAATIVISWLVFSFLLDVGSSRLQAVFGSLFMIASQANVSAVLGNDTSSQVLDGLFRSLALFCLYRYFWRTSPTLCNDSIDSRRTKYYSYSLLFFGMALLSKETAASLLIQVVALVILARAIPNVGSRKQRASLVHVTPFLVIFILYMIARQLIVQPGIYVGLGAEVYQFHIGLNIFKNLVLCLLTVAVPVSSVALYTAAKSVNPLLILFYLSATAVFLFTAVYGSRLSSLRNTAGVCACLGALTFASAIGLNHVSELYAYAAIPFASVIVGIALGEIKNAIWHRKSVRAAYFVLVTGLLVSHVIAVQTKSFQLVSNGKRAKRLLYQIVPYVRELPTNGTAVLLNPPGSQLEYSVYRMNGFNVLLYGGEHRIRQLACRGDISVKIVDAPPRADPSGGRQDLVLTLSDENVFVLNPSDILRQHE